MTIFDAKLIRNLVSPIIECLIQRIIIQVLAFREKLGFWIIPTIRYFAWGKKPNFLSFPDCDKLDFQDSYYKLENKFKKDI
ncbi:hypothetical protein CK510_15505 [Brunnivagina elsteri CCALA 953]|uniref:Uncharacterized protein n=1 Tax=Brunnivagina elsteri CCALA 953 TaxID=987040 RepID=A0A2A2THD8_9CYAN|nr:hypothetical protein CK510_15505 [Calothrix elsteri CCALA 953]